MKFQFEISIKPTLPHPISFLLLGNIGNYQYLPIIIDQKRQMAQIPRSLWGSRWLALGK